MKDFFFRMLLMNLTLGTGLTIVFLWVYQKNIYAKTNDLGKYLYEQSHKTQKPNPEDTVFRWILIWVIYYLIVLTVYAIANIKSGTLISDNQIEALNETIKNLETGTDLMLSITITTTLILASFRKPYYILFRAQDVANKYHLLEFVIPAILTRLIAIINLIVANLINRADKYYLKATLLNAEIWLLSIACLLCFIIFTRTYRIFFSVETAELSLLNNLRQHLYDPDRDLESILVKENGQEFKNLIAVENYLIKQLQIKADRAQKKLKKYIKLSEVEYWDASNKVPRQGIGKYLPQVTWFLSLIILFSVALIEIEFLGLSILALINAEQILTPILSHLSSDDFFILLSIISLIVLFFYFFNSSKLSPILRAHAYGKYGYCFMDEKSTPQYYFSRYSLIQQKPAKWLCALLNLLTLYQIELLNGHPKELLENLCTKLSEEENEIKRFSLELAYASCYILLLKESSKNININEIPQIEWSYKCKNELFFDFVCAILIDVGKPLNI